MSINAECDALQMHAYVHYKGKALEHELAACKTLASSKIAIDKLSVRRKRTFFG